MKDKWEGTFSELKAFVDKKGIKGNWIKGENDEVMFFRGPKGHKMSYYPTNCTIHIQGTKTKQQELEAIFAGKLESEEVQGVASQDKDPKIFIVHGHDTEALDGLDLFLRRLGLETYILKNQAGSSETLIEALEQKIYRDSAFGIILMTPDDWGYARDNKKGKQPRARQNVIFEMGMAFASLGRDRCAILKKQNLELPSDLEGIIRYDFKKSVKEVGVKLVEHLRKAGIPIDNANLASALSD